MDIPALKELISTIGFPITVAIFVLWRLEGAMKELVKAVVGLAQIVTVMNDRLEQVVERRAP